jgi:transcriptional regulator with XRE-family HTH domain
MKFRSIKDYLEKTGKTEKELADSIGVSQAFINMLKRGEKRPSPEVAARIEAVTGVPLRDLLFPETKTA